MLYFSSDIKKQLPSFYSQIERVLNQANQSFQLLPLVGDIWCKDWMPVPTGSKDYIKFKFDPHYLKGLDEQPKPDVDMVTSNLQLVYEQSDIVLDGGNLVRNRSKAIVTDKIYEENPTLNKLDLINGIKTALGLKELIVIPRESKDFVGNADGMVRFIDEKTVFINDYSFVNEEFKDQLNYQLKENGLDIIDLPYMPQRSVSEGESNAMGNYINFLEVGDKIVLPTFGLDSDRMAFEILRRNLPGKEIIPLGSIELANLGGVLNSVSWSDEYLVA